MGEGQLLEFIFSSHVFSFEMVYKETTFITVTEHSCSSVFKLCLLYLEHPEQIMLRPKFFLTCFQFSPIPQLHRLLVPVSYDTTSFLPLK